MTQTLAIFLDAYRELNSRKLFWITLILSVVVVVSFALVGINEEGLRLIVWDVPFPLNTTLMSAETFYKTMYVTLGIQIWLAWVATILALVSTASIFPDLIRPISAKITGSARPAAFASDSVRPAHRRSRSTRLVHSVVSRSGRSPPVHGGEHSGTHATCWVSAVSSGKQ